MMDKFDDPGTTLNTGNTAPRTRRRRGWLARNCSCCCTGLGWLPVLLMALIAAMLVGTYTWAVLNGDVYAIFPYISDTGANAPERSYFSLMLTLASAVLFVIVHIRYHQIQNYKTQVHQGNQVVTLNRRSYYLGVGAAFGMLLVANFQDNEIFVVHFIGAFMVYGGGTVYAWIQAVVSTRIGSSRTGGGGASSASITKITQARFILAGLCTITFVLVGVFAQVGFNEAPFIKDLPPGCGKNYNGRTTDKFDDSKPWPGIWEPCMAGYRAHLVSTVNEWLLTLFFGLYFLTFSYDFANLTASTEVKQTGGRGLYDIDAVGSPGSADGWTPETQHELDSVALIPAETAGRSSSLFGQVGASTGNELRRPAVMGMASPNLTNELDRPGAANTNAAEVDQGGLGPANSQIPYVRMV